VLGRQIRKQSGKRWRFIWRGLAIGRVLKFRNIAILKWIRSFGVQDLRTNAPAKIVELDEMHTYIGSKKYCWIWSAVDGNGKKFRFKGELSQDKHSKASSKILQQQA
jgi:hypothetical protein